MASAGAAFFARHLFDGQGWRSDVRVETDPAGVIRAMAPGAERGARVVDVLLPGLVDAHVHLELGVLDRAPASFPSWLRAVIRDRSRGGLAAARARAAANLARCMQNGATAFGDVDTLGTGVRALEAAGVAARSYGELLGFDADPDTARELCAVTWSEHPCVQRGFSPHAPYSVSPELFRAARASGVPLAIHVSESEEEVRFLEHGDGPLRDLLQELGKWDGRFRAPGCSPLAWLHRQGCTGPDVLLIHMQILRAGDLELLARTRSPVVICPGTIDWFDRPAPRVGEMLAAGIPLALGTDSPASNRSLDMFREMELLRRLCPDIPPREVLKMATVNGGRALLLDVGRLAVGSRLDAVVLEAPVTDSKELDEWLTCGCAGRRELLRAGRSWDGPDGRL